MKFFRIASLALLASLSGCGVMTYPAVQRLSPDQQAQVNNSWNNMLSPADRLDRELLLDVLIAFQMHQSGVDRLKFESEKDYAGGTVTMTITFNRTSDSSDDRFTVDVKDKAGKTTRHEVYSGAEVLSHVQTVAGSFDAAHPATQPATQAAQLTADQKAREAWLVARWTQIMTSTRPSDSPMAAP